MANSITIQKGIQKRTRAIRYAGAVMTLLALVGFSAPAALGQQCTLNNADTWSAGQSGYWSNGNNWLGGVPNSSSTNACITDGTSGVALDMNASVSNLQLASGNQLTVDGGNSLSIYGTQLINAGQITIQASSSYAGADAYLNFDNGLETTLSGGGTVTLASPYYQAYLDLSNNGAGTILYNYDTIQGVGTINNTNAQLYNYGVINANSSDSSNNELWLKGGTVVNTGLMIATNSGDLQLRSTTVNNTGWIEAMNNGEVDIWSTTVNNTGGTIAANGPNSEIDLFYGATIQGGTLTNYGGGYLGTGLGSSTLVGSPDFSNPVTINGTFKVQGGTTLNLSGTIVNNGSIVVTTSTSTPYTYNAILNILPPGAEISGGTVTLWSGDPGTTAYLSLNNSGVGSYLNNSSTIQGIGIIDNTNSVLVNFGTIVANASSSDVYWNLTLQNGLVANSSLMGATNYGTLELRGTTVNNSGGTIEVDGPNASVYLDGGTTIEGGRLWQTNNGGFLGTPTGATATLAGGDAYHPLVINGSYTSAPGSTTNLSGAIGFSGNILVEAGYGVGNTYLNILPAGAALAGGGTMTLASDSTGTAYLTLSNGGAGSSLQTSNIIEGAGIIDNTNALIVNNGTINADANAFAPVANLILQNGSVTNGGLMEATNYGTLELSGTTVNNQGGTIAAKGSNAWVFIGGGTTIQGGTLANNGAFLGTPGPETATLDGSTSAGAVVISGTYTSGLGSTTYLAGSIVNSGNIQVNGGNGQDTYLQALKYTNLTGGGTVTLATSPGGGKAWLSGGGNALENVDNTIQGVGVIDLTNSFLLNDSGTINANSGGGPPLNYLSLYNGQVLNTSLMEATANGELQLNHDTIANGVGSHQGQGTIAANGSGAAVVIAGGTTIEGGTLSNNGGWFFGTYGGTPVPAATLDGSTAAGPVTINGTYTGYYGSTTDLNGTIIDKGNILVNAGTGSDTHLALAGNVTLSGGGVVTLATDGTGTAYLALGGFGLTNSGNTIEGVGAIDNTNSQLINSGTINANANSSSHLPGLGLLNGSVTNGGGMEATNYGILELSSTTVNNQGGTIEANGGDAVVMFDGGTTIQGGTLTNNGVFLGTPSMATATLDGSTSAVTINGTYTSDIGSTTNLNGTIINNGSIQVNAGNGSNTHLNVPAYATLIGTGTVTLATDNTATAYLSLNNNGGSTLINYDTIQGVGIIDNTNSFIGIGNSGTINANSSNPVTLLSVLTLENGTVLNFGLMEATNYGTFDLSSTTVGNAGSMEATNSGTLEVSGATVNNAEGTITAVGSGASVLFDNGAVIHGGTLNNNGGAFFGTPAGGWATLDGSTSGGVLTLNGTYTTQAATNAPSYTILKGTIVNNGNLQVNGGGGSIGWVLVPGSATLTGGGTLTLNNADGVAYLDLDQWGATLDNVNNTIQGTGIISGPGAYPDPPGLINEAGGTINANAAGGMVISSATVTNMGLIEATNQGLDLAYDTIYNKGGTIAANGAYGGVVIDVDTVIYGGTLNNNGSHLGSNGGGITVTLDGSDPVQGAVTINGTYTNELNSTTILKGSIINNAAGNGNILVYGGYGADGVVEVPGSVTLTGGGTVTLDTLSNCCGGYAYLSLPNSTSKLDNVDNTIQGVGIISNNGTLINEAGGTINGNSAVGIPLSIQGGAVTNAGLMEATGSGTLELYQTTVNNAGGTITAVGSTASVWLDNGTVLQGGTLTDNGGLFFGTPTSSSATLDGSTSAGAVTINGTYTNAFGSTTYLAGSIVNNAAQNGQILVNGGNGSDGFLSVPTSATLTGGGTVWLNTLGGGGNAWISVNNGATLDNVDNTIEGEGLILNNGRGLINESGGTINANSTVGYLTEFLTLSNGSVTNAGLMEATNEGILELTNTTVNNAGGTITAVGPGAEVFFDGSTTIQGGTLNNNNGGLFLGTPYMSFATLDGSTGAGAVTINGTYTSDIASVTDLVGTIINNGAITANGGATVDLLNADVQGGTLTNNGAAFFGTPSGYKGTLDGSTGAGAVTINGTYTSDYGSSTSLYGQIVNHGNIQVNGGNGNQTSLNVPGNVTLTGGGTLTLSNMQGGGGTYLSLSPGTTLDNVDNTIQGEGVISLNNSGSLINEAGGTILANSTGSPLTSELDIESGTVTNYGTMQVNSGNLLHLVQGTFTNFNSATGTLNGGTYNVYGPAASPGTLQIDALGNAGGEIVNNAATILLDGPSSNFFDAAGLDALANFSNNTATGSFTIQDGRAFTSPGDFSNAGAVLIGNNSTFTAGTGAKYDYTQTAGTTQVNGTLDAAFTHIEGGTLGGAGTINGPVKVGGGTIIAGAPGVPGTLTINGDFMQDAGGTMIIDITGADSFGVIDVTGMASLGGTLDIDFLNGFKPTPGEMFDFLNYGSLDPLNDDFSNIDISDCPNCAAPVFGANGVVFEPEGPGGPVPEPSVLTLLGTALIAIGGCAIRWRRGAKICSR